MKRFDVIKTIQLALLILLAGAALVTVLRDPILYEAIAADAHVRRLSVILWLVLGIGFIFLFYDFNSFTNLKRENMELDNAVYSDALTGIANRYSIDMYIAQFRDKPLPEDMGCVTISITNLGEINGKLGHGGGDDAIREFSEVLQDAASGACVIGRNGGNKFIAILRDCSEKRMEKFLRAVEEQVRDRNASRGDAPLRYRAGAAVGAAENVRTLTELVALSDHRAVLREAPVAGADDI